MALQTANQFNLQPDVAGSLLGGFQAGQQISQNMGEQQRQAQFRQLSGVLTDPQASPEQKMQAQSQLMKIDPAKALQVRQSLTERLSEEELSQATTLARDAVRIDALQTPQGRLQAAKNRKQELLKEGETSPELDQLIEALETGNNDLAQQMLDKGKQAGQILGVLETGSGIGGAGGKDVGKIGTYNPRDYTVESFSQFTATGDPSVLERYSEKTINIGDVPHVWNPVVKQYQPVTTAEKVGSNKAIVNTLVKEAEAEAKQRGETLSELNRARAALPGLTSTVNQLRELAPLVTSTLGGKIFNEAVKQTGFGSTKGATARAKYISIINNQVLPLLKPTFGGAFTVEEGKALKATMGDPDATPEEKLAQLDAFIANKTREIEAKEGILQQTGEPEPETPPESAEAVQPPPVNDRGWQLMTDAQGNMAYVGPSGEVEEVQ